MGVGTELSVVNRMVIHRFTAAGTLDNSFHLDGRVEVLSGTAGQQLRDTEVATDGSSLLVSVTEADAFFLTAVRPDGTKDTSFAGGGSTNPLPENVFHGRSVSVAPDGGIFVAGTWSAACRWGW